MTLITSTYPNSGYQVFNTIQASHADLELINGVFYLGDPLQELCRYNAVVSIRVTVAVAEQLQETTLTPVAAANSVYQFIIQQWNPVTNLTMTRTYTYTTAASGDTATTISTAFKAMVEADAATGQIQIAATGTTTIVLTALTGYAVFTVSIVQVGGGLSQATGTAGIAAVGTTAALALEGYTENINSASSYTQIDIEYAPITGQNIKEPIGVLQSRTVFLLESATNYAALLAAFNYLFAGRQTSVGGVANPEAIAYI